MLRMHQESVKMYIQYLRSKNDSNRSLFESTNTIFLIENNSHWKYCTEFHNTNELYFLALFFFSRKFTQSCSSNHPILIKETIF